MVEVGSIDVMLNHVKNLSSGEVEAIEGSYGGVVADALRALQVALPGKVHRMQNLVETPLGVRHPIRGLLKKGGGMSYVDAFNPFGTPTVAHFNATVMSASSATAMAAVAENTNLRHLYVGCVVVLRNPNELKENWYVYVTRLYTDPNQPHLIGEGVWVFNQEDFSKVDPTVVLTDDRSGVMSNYRVVLFSNTILGVRKIYPAFVDTQEEDNLHCSMFFDVNSLTLHPLQLPPLVIKERSHPSFSALLNVLSRRAQAEHGTVRSQFYPHAF